MAIGHLATFDAVLKAHRVCEDGEPRWRDIELGEWLELIRSRNIRLSIESNRNELEEYGTLLVREAKSGGRPAKEYWLTFEQALVICQLSDARNAREVRRVLIKVFKFVIGGGPLATAPVSIRSAIDAAADRIIGPLTCRMDRMECKQEYLDQTVRNFRRLPLTRSTREAHFITVARHGGYCPCCEHTVITDGDRFTGENEDHWYGRNKRRVDQTWIVCAECNARMERDSVYKQSRYAQFMAYQSRLAQTLSQLRLPF